MDTFISFKKVVYGYINHVNTQNFFDPETSVS